jgi:hypothetical protein
MPGGMRLQLQRQKRVEAASAMRCCLTKRRLHMGGVFQAAVQLLCSSSSSSSSSSSRG